MEETGIQQQSKRQQKELSRRVEVEVELVRKERLKTADEHVRKKKMFM